MKRQALYLLSVLTSIFIVNTLNCGGPSESKRTKQLGIASSSEEGHSLNLSVYIPSSQLNLAEEFRLNSEDELGVLAYKKGKAEALKVTLSEKLQIDSEARKVTMTVHTNSEDIGYKVVFKSSGSSRSAYLPKSSSDEVVTVLNDVSDIASKIADQFAMDNTEDQIPPDLEQLYKIALTLKKSNQNYYKPAGSALFQSMKKDLNSKLSSQNADQLTKAIDAQNTAFSDPVVFQKILDSKKNFNGYNFTEALIASKKLKQSHEVKLGISFQEYSRVSVNLIPDSNLQKAYVSEVLIPEMINLNFTSLSDLDKETFQKNILSKLESANEDEIFKYTGLDPADPKYPAYATIQSAATASLNVIDPNLSQTILSDPNITKLLDKAETVSSEQEAEDLLIEVKSVIQTVIDNQETVPKESTDEILAASTLKIEGLVREIVDENNLTQVQENSGTLTNTQVQTETVETVQTQTSTIEQTQTTTAQEVQVVDQSQTEATSSTSTANTASTSTSTASSLNTSGNLGLENAAEKQEAVKEKVVPGKATGKKK